MTVTTKTYNVNKTKQLVDLNGHLTNFKSVFTVKSDKETEFDVAIVNQNILDSEDDTAVKYRHATGIINGEIFNDNDIYQNYFLIIVSKKPCECEVTVDVNQIPSKRNNTFRENELPEIIEDVNYNSPLLTEKYSYTHKKKKSNRVWWIILYVILAILAGFVIFYYLKKYKYIYAKQDSDRILNEHENIIQSDIHIPEKQNLLENLIVDNIPVDVPVVVKAEPEIVQQNNIVPPPVDIEVPKIEILPENPKTEILQHTVSKNQTLLHRLNNLKTTKLNK